MLWIKLRRIKAVARAEMLDGEGQNNSDAVNYVQKVVANDQ